MEDDPILNFIVETRSMTLRNIDAVLEKRSEVVCQHAKLLREIDEGLSVLTDTEALLTKRIQARGLDPETLASIIQ